MIARRLELPTRLMEICDRLTRYIAVIASLSNAARVKKACRLTIPSTHRYLRHKIITANLPVVDG
jgi:hypothetical protein